VSRGNDVRRDEEHRPPRRIRVIPEAYSQSEAEPAASDRFCHDDKMRRPPQLARIVKGRFTCRCEAEAAVERRQLLAQVHDLDIKEATTCRTASVLDA
jgi:hypothetical protein